jgi:hypothetical protein
MRSIEKDRLRKLVTMKAEAKNKIKFIDNASPAAARGLWTQMHLWWRRIALWAHPEPRRLRLCESLPLGERRFVAVIEFEKARYLVGGTPASLALLAQLGDDEDRTNEPATKVSRSREIATDHNPDSTDAGTDVDAKELR